MANPSYLALTEMRGRVLASQQIAAGDTIVYQPGAGETAKIASAVICNASGVAVIVSVSVLKTGQTMDGTHRVISGYSLAAGGSLDLRPYGLGGAMLGEGDFISVNAGTASAVTIVLTGAVSL